MKIKIVDRYTALGIPYPNPKTVCKGQCEGTGWLPIYMDEDNKVFKLLWNKAEKKKHAKDGWHFIKCPDCKGTGKCKPDIGKAEVEQEFGIKVEVEE